MGAQVDASSYRVAVNNPATSLRDRSLLRSFVSHAVWSNERLYDAGYIVDVACTLCGGPSDSPGHRLFACRGTQALRDEYLQPHDLDFIRYSASVKALAMGLQILPPQAGERQEGLGHEKWEEWTLTGCPISDVLVGDVYTDGSCLKMGPPTWSRTG